MLNQNSKTVNLFKMKKLIILNIMLEVIFQVKIFTKNLLPEECTFRFGDDP